MDGWKQGSDMPPMNEEVLAYINRAYEIAINIRGVWHYRGAHGKSIPAEVNPQYWIYLPTPPNR
ncbi:hypothetical protein D8M09_17190 [Enterobacter sp. R1(2018)]|nr:hypothetical protein D8M09_17190 [Enterobacter sp. R1(2018)]